MNQLVKRAQKRDLDAFSELMRLCEQDMYRVARSFLKNDADIADAMQDAILACFEQLQTLRAPAHFKTWLIRILINKCNDIIRAENKTYSTDKLPEEGCPDPALTNVEFEMLMDLLEEQYRTVLVLRYSESLSVRQISQIMDITESAVKQRLKRGRDKARELYDEARSPIKLLEVPE